MKTTESSWLPLGISRIAVTDLMLKLPEHAGWSSRAHIYTLAFKVLRFACRFSYVF